jgi:hypothetical protein
MAECISKIQQYKNLCILDGVTRSISTPAKLLSCVSQIIAHHAVVFPPTHPEHIPTARPLGAGHSEVQVSEQQGALGLVFDVYTNTAVIGTRRETPRPIRIESQA